MTNRIVDPHDTDYTQTEDPALRPRNLDEYIGQSAVVDNLKVYIQAAKKRGDAMDHVLLAGPPDWARRLWHTSLLKNWVSIFVQLLDLS